MSYAARTAPLVPVTPEALANAWALVCERVRDGEPKLHAATEEGAPLGLTGSQFVQRARENPVLYEAGIAASEAFAAGLLAQLDALGAKADMSPADRVKAQAIQWRLSKLDPRRWGDHRQIELGGPGGGPVPIAITITAVDARSLARDDE